MGKQLNKWQPVKLTWPEKSTAWLNELDGVKEQIADQQGSTEENLKDLEALISHEQSPLAKDATTAMEKAQAGIDEQFNNPPYCLAVTPFQTGVGSGEGYNKYLSAPNLMNHLMLKLNDGGDSSRPTGDNLGAILILFLSMNYRQLSDLLTVFNRLLNIEELEIAQRRADYLDNLEVTRKIIPKAGILPGWQTLNVEKINIVSQIKNNLTSQVANLKSYTDDNQIETLKKLMAQKQQQQIEQDEQLEALKASLVDSPESGQMLTSYLEGGTTSDIKTQLLNIPDTPSHQWILCAGLLFVGEPNSLSFIKEVIGL